MRKNILTVLSLLMVIFILTLSSYAENNEGMGKKVELKVITWRVEDKEYFDWAHELFEKENPNIDVKLDAVPTKQWNQLKTARIASNDVDVMATQFWDLKDENMRSHFLDLKGQPYLDNYYEDVLKMAQVNGKQLQLPSNLTGTSIVFYNKKIFSDLGLTVPQTWSEFINVCKKIKESGTAPILFGGKDQWPVNMILSGLEVGIVRGSEPNFYGKDSENIRKGINKFTDPVWVEVFEKLDILNNYFLTNTLGLGYGRAPGMFATGKAAMLIDGTWSKFQILDANPDFEVGAFLMPGSDKAEYNDNLPIKIGGGWSIYKESSNIEAAHKYLEFTSRKDVYEKYTKMVKMIPVIKGIELETPLAKEIASFASQSKPTWSLFNIPGGKYSNIQCIMNIFLDKMTPEEAAQKMQNDLMESKKEWQ